MDRCFEVSGEVLSKFPISSRGGEKTALENRGLDLRPMGSDLALPVSPSVCDYLCDNSCTQIVVKTFKRNQIIYVLTVLRTEVVGLCVYFDRELG